MFASESMDSEKTWTEDGGVEDKISPESEQNLNGIYELKSKQNPKGIWAEPINESCSDEFVRSSGQHSSG